MASVLDEMIDILSQERGSITSKASIVMFAERMGLDENSIRPEHVDKLVDQLKPGLFVFVGENKTEFLARRMRGLGKVRL